MTIKNQTAVMIYAFSWPAGSGEATEAEILAFAEGLEKGICHGF